MIKYLRIAVTALNVSACVLLMVLWVRSYTWRDELGVLFAGNSKLALLQSHPGCMVAALSYAMSDTLSLDQYSRIFNTQRVKPPHKLTYRSAFPWVKASSSGIDSEIQLPYWLIICAFGTLAAAPWIRWSKRFSLRTLLIATTLITLGLGLVAAF